MSQDANRNEHKNEQEVTFLDFAGSDTSCFYRIREFSANEYIRESGEEKIARHKRDNSTREVWHIYPAENGALRIQNLRSRKFIRVDAPGYHWGDSYRKDSKSQLFTFVDRDTSKGKTRWQLRPSKDTSKRSMIDKVSGLMRRWDPKNEKNFYYLFVPVAINSPTSQKYDDENRKLFQLWDRDNPNATKKFSQKNLRAGEFAPPDWEQGETSQEPSIPKPSFPSLGESGRRPPSRTGEYHIGDELIKSALIDDPRYSDKIAQAKNSEYYIIKWYQYYDCSDRWGAWWRMDHLSSVDTGHTIYKGMSRSTVDSIEKTNGWSMKANINARLNKRVSLNIQSSYDHTKKELQKDELKQVQWSKATTTKVIPSNKEPYERIIWSKINKFVIEDRHGERIAVWEDVTQNIIEMNLSDRN